MIEQAIYFGLGCALSGLLALAFTPVLWARALRLTRKRLQVQIPVSMQEILADRDQLRAAFAVEARVLEQEVERVRAGKAADMSELGWRATQIFTLSQKLTAARLHSEALGAEIQRLERENAEMSAGLGATQIALQQNHVYFEQRLDAHEALRKVHLLLEETAERQRATIGALQTRIRGLEMTIEDGARARAAVERQLESWRQQAALAGEERDLLATQLGAAQTAQDTLRKRLTAETVAAAGLAEAKRALQGELDAALVKLRLKDEDIAAAGRAADLAREAKTPVSAADPRFAGDALLRASIHGLGLAIAEMAAAAKRDQASRDAGPNRMAGE